MSKPKRPNPFAEFLDETEPEKQKKSKRQEDQNFMPGADLERSTSICKNTPTGKPVPNVFPRIQPTNYRIALIGESPGEKEENSGQPFVGPSGYHLNARLSSAGIIRDQCFIGNICQIRPPNNDISLFSLTGPEISEGLQQLKQDLDVFRPHICVLLGKTALLAAKGVADISNWRGSLFLGENSPFTGRKCIATYHPAACLRQYEWTPLLFFDLKKALKHATNNKLELPSRELLTNLSFEQLMYELDNILLLQSGTISCDIEGYVGDVSCISIATSPYRSFLVPFTNMDGSSYWTLDQEVEVWRRLSRILADRQIKKIWQNGLYDRFVLQYGNSVVINGNAEDTMLKFAEMYCELPKGLAFQCSVLTDEPYYKSERKSDSLETYHRYCCKDSCVTFEISERLDKLLTPAQQVHYRRNHDLLNPLLYMELRGIRYDIALAKDRLREIEQSIYETQVDLDHISGRGFGGNLSKDQLKTKVREIMCWKRDQTKIKKDYEFAYDWAMRLLLGPAPLSKAELGKLSQACEVSLNVDSYPQVRKFLYEELALPEQFKPKKRGEDEAKITSDYAAMLKLKKKVDLGTFKDKALDLIIDIGQLSTRATSLRVKTDPDGRIRCGYNIVGTETMRLACYESPTGSGYNLQTATKGIPMRPIGHPLRLGMRDLCLADPGSNIGECDLSGADGWTIGAILASLGDTSMLEDLKAGIKPAARICYILKHGMTSLYGKTRIEVKLLLKEISKDDWLYFACKQGIWGLCYGMGPDLLATVIAKKSAGTLWLDRKQVEEFRSAVFTAYNIRELHNWAAREIRKNPVLTAPNGFRRRFFGRPTEIQGEYLAHLPQVITTHATNSAMYNLWIDPDNRFLDSAGRVRLRCEPLHQVHDALLDQTKVENIEWKISKTKSWFDNPVVIAGIRIVIPFEGSYGTNWALDEKSKIGTI